MTKWQNIRLWSFREDGKNILVAARNLDEAREVAGIKTSRWNIVDCDLIMTEWMFTQRQDINPGMEP